MTPMQLEIAGLIVSTLDLEVAPGEIAPDQALFQDGLGLDSIDALELALEISQKYGLKLRSDDDDNVRIFSSLSALARHIEHNRRQ